MLEQEFKAIEKRLSALARASAPTRRLMTTSGVGASVTLTFAAAIDDPGRFRSSRMVGAHFGLTPRKHQSGETDVTGRISRIGDHGVRVALYEAANVILTRAVTGSDLKSWALGVAKRAGMRKAKVALARKLSVVLHRMLADGTTFMARRRRNQAVTVQVESRCGPRAGGRAERTGAVIVGPARTGAAGHGAAQLAAGELGKRHPVPTGRLGEAVSERIVGAELDEAREQDFAHRDLLERRSSYRCGPALFTSRHSI